MTALIYLQLEHPQETGQILSSITSLELGFLTANSSIMLFKCAVV